MLSDIEGKGAPKKGTATGLGYLLVTTWHDEVVLSEQHMEPQVSKLILAGTTPCICWETGGALPDGGEYIGYGQYHRLSQMILRERWQELRAQCSHSIQSSTDHHMSGQNGVTVWTLLDKSQPWGRD
jgi:hypothetical protein